MFFTSFEYALFLCLMYIIYWGLLGRSLKAQNLLILFGSYFFYAQWDSRFLLLLFASTVINFFIGERISAGKWKKGWMRLSLFIALGILCLFKYYNFFIVSFQEFAHNLGFTVQISTLSVILPVGISFYTFHGLSYILDIYYKRIKAEKSFIDYAIFISFFPLLIAGPIERATTLLPQVAKPKSINYAKHIDGLRQILWGLVKKIVIADNCAFYANKIFSTVGTSSGSTLLIGAVFFAIQIYTDFSAYTDIATGSAKLFGYDLIRNFNYPYFSRDIAEFWRRWHISLSSWFKDYVYIPLGGSAKGRMIQIRNTFIIFILSGFWHGANWTFIVWGLLNAIYFLPLLLLGRNRNNIAIVADGRMVPTVREFFQMLITFAMVVFGWIFFRSENIAQAIGIVKKIFSLSFFTLPKGSEFGQFVDGEFHPFLLFILILIFFVIEWIGRKNQYAIQNIFLSKHRFLRYGFYSLLLICLIIFSSQPQAFIYFQF